MIIEPQWSFVPLLIPVVFFVACSVVYVIRLKTRQKASKPQEKGQPIQFTKADTSQILVSCSSSSKR